MIVSNRFNLLHSSNRLYNNNNNHCKKKPTCFCFIFENNVVQPFVQLGNNVILWSGNHIGHHSVIKDHCFISSHVVISGFVEVGENCFFGVNATVANNIKIAKDCWISPSVTIMKDTKVGELYKGLKAEAAPVNTYKFFKVTEA